MKAIFFKEDGTIEYVRKIKPEEAKPKYILVTESYELGHVSFATIYTLISKDKDFAYYVFDPEMD